MTRMTKDHAIAILRRMQEPEPFEPQINESAFDALEMAIQALSAQDTDTISRKAAIDALYAEFEYVYCYNCDHEGNEEWCEDCHRKYMKWSASRDTIERVLNDLPSAQPEITDEQAIKHLQSSGWMQNHDKQMYEMGLKEQLADDSGSYDALLPSAQPDHSGDVNGKVETDKRAVESVQNVPNDDLVSKKIAIEAMRETFKRNPTTAICAMETIRALPSAQPDIIRCKDCVHSIINDSHPDKPRVCFRTRMCGTVHDDWFCWDGKRRIDETVEKEGEDNDRA